MTLPYHHSLTGTLREQIGEMGVLSHEIDLTCRMLGPARDQISLAKEGSLGAIVRSISQDAELAEIEAIASDWRARFRHLIVIGSGGSGLGGRVLAMLKFASQPPLDRPLIFLDNLDIDGFKRVVASLDCERTGILVISKSGETIEPLAQMILLLDRMSDALGEAQASTHFFALTSTHKDNPLLSIARTRGITIIPHDPALGGRFSIFSNVGLLPAAFIGLDIRALRLGAKAVLAHVVETPSLTEVEPARGAAAHYLLILRGKSVSLMMPYGETLFGLALWYRQCFAESLGKDERGATPVTALGTVDQHSQLQLFLGGPRDKFFTLILRDLGGQGMRIDTRLDCGGLDYLRGHTLGDVIAAQQEATLSTLLQGGCPVRVIRVPELDERAMGALLAHMMFEIIFLGQLLGVNAFDQPAVEESKHLTRQHLSAKPATEMRERAHH